MPAERPKRIKRYRVVFNLKDSPVFKLNEDFCSIDELKKWIEQELRGLPAGIFAGKVSLTEIR